MFEHSAEKIRKIAVVVFWIVTVASVILAFVFGWQEIEVPYGWSSTRTETVFRPQLFFTLLIGVPVGSYINTLFLVTFSDLANFARRTYDAVGNTQLIIKQEVGRVIGAINSEKTPE